MLHLRLAAVQPPRPEAKSCGAGWEFSVIISAGEQVDCSAAGLLSNQSAPHLCTSGWELKRIKLSHPFLHPETKMIPGLYLCVCWLPLVAISVLCRSSQHGLFSFFSSSFFLFFFFVFFLFMCLQFLLYIMEQQLSLQSVKTQQSSQSTRDKLRCVFRWRAWRILRPTCTDHQLSLQYIQTQWACFCVCVYGDKVQICTNLLPSKKTISWYLPSHTRTGGKEQGGGRRMRVRTVFPRCSSALLLITHAPREWEWQRGMRLFWSCMYSETKQKKNEPKEIQKSADSVSGISHCIICPFQPPGGRAAHLFLSEFLFFTTRSTSSVSEHLERRRLAGCKSAVSVTNWQTRPQVGPIIRKEGGGGAERKKKYTIEGFMLCTLQCCQTI